MDTSSTTRTITASPKNLTTTPPLSAAELAYLGGFFDGEGCAGLYYYKAKKNWAPVLQIVQNYSKQAERMFRQWNDQFKGTLTAKASAHGPTLCLQIRSEKSIRRFIEETRPYVKLKTRQLIVLEAWFLTKHHSFRVSQILKALKRMEV